MKKIFIAIFFLLFFLGGEYAFAQATMMPTFKITPTQEESTKASTLEYQLPYPGILPDNPLYFIKAARDKIIGFLISDPLKKAEFNLLQADKRLNAGVMLFKKGNVKLAESTISKGENYFEQAIEKTRQAKTEGRDVKEQVRRLLDASLKHREVISDLENRAPLDQRRLFESLEKRVVNLWKKADSLVIK